MATPEFNQILTLLNNSGLAVKNQALYNAIKQLILANVGSASEITNKITNLNTQIISSILSGTSSDRAIYKPQNILGNNLVLWFETDTGILWAFNTITNTWVDISGAPVDATYLTATDESSRLPNSRELLAGSGIVFDDSVPNKRTVNTSVTADYVVLSDGGVPVCTPINDGNGQFIYITYTP